MLDMATERAGDDGSMNGDASAPGDTGDMMLSRWRATLPGRRRRCLRCRSSTKMMIARIRSRPARIPLTVSATGNLPEKAQSEDNERADGVLAPAARRRSRG